MPRNHRISMEKLAKILLIIFACSTIISALSIYYTHQLPTYEPQRTTTYIATATTTTCLAISAFLYIRYRLPPPTKNSEKFIKKLTAPYKELIAKTTQNPPETQTTIETESLEDLAKIAEILARPILQATRNQKHIFYIIDNNTKYQYEEPPPHLKIEPSTTPKETNQT